MKTKILIIILLIINYTNLKCAQRDESQALLHNFLLKDAKTLPQVAPTDAKKLAHITDALGQHRNEIGKLQESLSSARVALILLYVALLTVAGFLVLRG